MADGEFRPVQYLGSKWRLLDAVAENVGSVRGDARRRVVDLFSGSGVVARRLAEDSPVLATDIQEYSRVLTEALLHPAPFDVELVLAAARRQLENPALRAMLIWDDAVLSQGDYLTLADQIERGSAIAHGSFGDARDAILQLAADQSWTLLSYYGGVYYSYRQAAELDTLRTVVSALPEAQRLTALAALLGTASDLVTSIGNHFAQPIRPRAGDGTLKLRQLGSVRTTRSRSVYSAFAARAAQYFDLRPAQFDSIALRRDFRDVLENLPADTGVVYADPPYTRDHYSRFYHVLETIALGDDPGITPTSAQGGSPSRGLYRLERHQSPFSIVREAPAAFGAIFDACAHRGVSLVLSYSPTAQNEKPRARVISVDRLLEEARARFGSVEVVAVDSVTHAKLNHSRLNAPVVREAEILILARP